VSYQGRDISGTKTKDKYKACKKEFEVYEHQTILYGLDYIKKRRAIIVEGAADVWRLGYGALSCFGTAFTQNQTNLLAANLDTAFILFDSDDDNAIKMAYELGHALSGRGVDVEILELDEGDPGDMPDKSAKELMRDLKL
jgi:DNA primase